MKKCLKKIIVVLCVMAMATQLMACSGKQPTSPANDSDGQDNQPTTSAPETSNQEDYEVAVIVKGMNSEYWQTVISGSKKAASELGNVHLTSYGPPAEANMDEQISILDDVISKKPDAIIIASTSQEATVPSLEKAYDSGIKVILIDGSVKSEKYDTFLATDNEKGGALAAQTMVDKLTEEGKELKGKIGILSAMAGVQSLTARNDGFKKKLAELAPDIEIADTKYSNGDVLKAVAAAEDMLTANADLIGFYADNNECGSAAAKVITERGLEDGIVNIAFDADDNEINGLETGAVDGIILQDPFGMGYKAVQSAIDIINGKTLEKYIDTGVQVATKDNMEDEDIYNLLYPPVVVD